MKNKITSLLTTGALTVGALAATAGPAQARSFLVDA